jgi:glycosyltransferase involved in cell wall biosynthesis
MLQPFISVVSPVYKAKEIVPELVRRIVASLSQITDDFEVILVEDGCPQNSWVAITEEYSKDKRIKGIKLSRNFGQHHAITAGLSESKGEWVVVMDCDLQDSPENIKLFLEKTKEGYDLVVGQKKVRKDRLIRRAESRVFYWILEKFTGVKVSERIGNFGIYHRKVIDAFLSIQEEYRSFGMLILWLGFSRLELEIESDKRFEGHSSYSFFKKWRLAIDTLTSFSDRMLRIVVTTGILISLTAIIFLIIHIARIYLNASLLLGWTSLILSIYLSLGLILISLGMVGIYVGKIFSQVKNRPLFIIEKITNND